MAAWQTSLPTWRLSRSRRGTAVDNHRIIVQEWLAEAFTMWGLAALIVAVTAIKVCPVLLSSTAALLVIASVG